MSSLIGANKEKKNLLVLKAIKSGKNSWTDLINDEALNFSEATLSRYLNKLKKEDYIGLKLDNEDRKVYTLKEKALEYFKSDTNIESQLNELMKIRKRKTRLEKSLEVKEK